MVRRTNERTSKQTNKRANERTSERANERANEQTNEQARKNPSKPLKLEPKRRLQRQERKGGVVLYQGYNFKKQTPYKTFSLFLIVCQNLSFFKVRTIIYL